MKKLLLTLVTLVTATAASAQIVLWNGDGKETGSDGGFWDRANPTVVEESGNKVLKITTKANPSGWDKEHCNAALPLGDADFKGLRRLTLKMKMNIGHNVLVKLVKDGDGGYSTGRLLWYDEKKGWNKLTFEFAAGPDNEKITDTGNTVLEIWPFEDGADALSNIGQTIYIDDIQLEGPMVNGSAIRTLSDNALSGNITITGSLSKGQYKDTWTPGDWKDVAYDDYVLLNSKLSNTITSVDIKGATVSDFDGNQFFFKNPNNIVYATSEYGYSHNVVANGATSKLILNDAYPFNAPTGFTATSVELTRNVQAGINSFCLPFSVTATEVGAAKIAKWKKGVTFETQDIIEANIPFITTGATAATKLNFGEKTVVTTPTTSDGKFVGIYAPKYTEGKYGINSAGKIQAGNSTTKCNAFHAWLTEIPAAAREITIDGDATGINSIENGKQKNDDVWYDLQGRRIGQWSMVNGQLKSGIYIINGKKVVVK